MSTSNYTEGADGSSSGHAGVAMMDARVCIGPFELKCPPVKKHKVAGHLVPTFRSAVRFINVKRRRVTIVILHPIQLKPGETSSPEAATVWDPDNEVLQDEDRVMIRFYGLARKNKQGEIEMKSSGECEDDGMNLKCCLDCLSSCACESLTDFLTFCHITTNR
jgi:hypothetical protein